MYQRESKGWFKHYDFILLDLICLQIAFFLAYVIRGVGWNPYSHLLYRNMAIFIEAADIVVIFFFETLKNVLKRGHYVEFIETLKHVLIVCAVSMSYLFLVKEAEKYSRFILITTIIAPNPKKNTPVLVWEISERDEENLDLYEGYPNYYRKEDLNIELLREGAEPEMVTAMVYIMENDFGHRAPSRYYYKVLHDGYKAFRFPMHILEGALKECMDKDAAQRMIEEVQA